MDSVEFAMHYKTTEMTSEGESETQGEWDVISPLPGLLGSFRISKEDQEDEQTANRLDQETSLIIRIMIVVMLLMTIASQSD